jgi:flagellar biosynthesis protein FlhB
MNGVYLGSKEETFIFSAYRTKNYLYHFVCYYITMIFATILYCLLYGLIAIIFSGEFVDVVISIMLLFFNIIFIASVQWLIFSVKKSVNLSVCAVLVIILISIVFVNTKFNIGAWGMLVRSNFKLERGFDITVITTVQILLSFVCFISVPIIYKKKYIL